MDLKQSCVVIFFAVRIDVHFLIVRIVEWVGLKATVNQCCFLVGPVLPITSVFVTLIYMIDADTSELKDTSPAAPQALVFVVRCLSAQPRLGRGGHTVAAVSRSPPADSGPGRHAVPPSIVTARGCVRKCHSTWPAAAEVMGSKCPHWSLGRAPDTWLR